MPDAKDEQLIGELTRATRDGKIRWTPTAKLQEFTTAFRGKYSIIVSQNPSDGVERLVTGGSEPVPLSKAAQAGWYELRVLDEFGDVLHTIDGPSVKPLLEAASRSSTSVERERAINEILEELESRYEKKAYRAGPRSRPPFLKRFGGA